jgi:hypothetical protein
MAAVAALDKGLNIPKGYVKPYNWVLQLYLVYSEIPSDSLQISETFPCILCCTQYMTACSRVPCLVCTAQGDTQFEMKCSQREGVLEVSLWDWGISRLRKV